MWNLRTRDFRVQVAAPNMVANSVMNSSPQWLMRRAGPAVAH
jgi:hypothetical protein